MSRRGIQLCLLSLALLTHGFSDPVSPWPRHAPASPPFAVASSAESSSWFWGWAWGGDSTISIVDRTPFLEFTSRPAAFGAYISDPLLGYVIPLESFTRKCREGEGGGREGEAGDERGTMDFGANLGCPRLCVEGRQPDNNESWIALVQRGDCQFVDKAREAQRLGAKAIVVGGDDPAISGNPDVLINMFSPGDSSDVGIAATFVRYTDYLRLSSHIARSNTTHNGIPTLSLLISPGSSSWDWYSPIVTFAILLLLPSSLTLTTLLVHRVRAARQAQLDRAPEDVVNSLPWRVWTGTGWEKHSGPVNKDGNSNESASASRRATTPEVEEGFALSPPSSSRIAGSSNQAEQHPAWFDNQSECAICLSEFEKGDKVRVLPCNHIFHLDEVDEWLTQRKKLCPVCKADVTRPANAPPIPEESTSHEPIDESSTPYHGRSHGSRSRTLSPSSSSRPPPPPQATRFSSPPASSPSTSFPLNPPTERTPLLSGNDSDHHTSSSHDEESDDGREDV